eukprot:TRINITY_DN37788_c0_g1_i1.p1 TRINITY_DN37788_c0_g1~~TRINITY_DN37788_c0_g1_i1.p1  ORF type:complete len:665 (-),score=166.47 TRINITY_DN37788_c0_g1_i1:485-2479(-)
MGAVLAQCDDPSSYLARGDSGRVEPVLAVATNESNDPGHVVQPGMAGALQTLRSRYPYLKLPRHELAQWINKCEEAVQRGDEEAARDALVRVELEVEQEEARLAAAFNLFKPPTADCLTAKEIRVMLDYLGFPAEDKDVEAVIAATDVDADRTMSLTEFQMYVGRMGGSHALFATRRASIPDVTDVPTDPEQVQRLRWHLIDCGIQDNEQAYWRMVLAQSEFFETAQLVDCQRSAVRHIRSLAKGNHEAALPDLQRRVQELGFSDKDLWMTLAWIREMAPIIVHVDLDKMLSHMESDTHYRNQFETRSSGGLLSLNVRTMWERDLFGGSYDEAKGFHKCKYGVLNVMNDSRGVVGCSQYGDSYFVLKDTRLRCTFSPMDSANLKAERLAVLDYYAHVLAEYDAIELKETLKVANSSEAALLGDSEKIPHMKYKETQIHGEVCFSKHVKRLVANTRHRGGFIFKKETRLKKLCAKYGWEFSWMDEERARMEKEERSKLGAEAWKERLQALAEKGIPDAKDVAPGCCRKGCGRKVNPGKTRSGKLFTTCCKGCVMGFGHDMTCGAATSGAAAPGMCKKGCGKPVSKGRTPAGRAFDTCCRGCASTGTCDASCGQDAVAATNFVVEPGMCRIGCGKKAAVSKDGKRKFDTCCRGCATGKGCSATCGR